MTVWSVLHWRKVRRTRKLAVIGSHWRIPENPGCLYRIEARIGDRVVMFICRPGMDPDVELAANLAIVQAFGRPVMGSIETLACYADHVPVSDSVEEALQEAAGK